MSITMSMPGTKESGGLPYILEPENADNWPSTSVTEQAIESIVQIIKRGYKGIKAETYPMSGGRLVANFIPIGDTPEGRMTLTLLMFAREGKTLPTDEVISILERIYREQGLDLPT